MPRRGRRATAPSTSSSSNGQALWAHCLDPPAWHLDPPAPLPHEPRCSDEDVDRRLRAVHDLETDRVAVIVTEPLDAGRSLDRRSLRASCGCSSTARRRVDRAGASQRPAAASPRNGCSTKAVSSPVSSLPSMTTPATPTLASTRSTATTTLTRAAARLRRLASPASWLGRVDRQELRGPRHLGRDRHEHRDRCGRHRQARVLGRWQHPRGRTARVDGGAVLSRHAGPAVTAATPTSRGCSTAASSTSARASTPTAPRWPWPTDRATSVPRPAAIRSTRSPSTA